MESITLEQFMTVLGRNSLEAAVVVLAVLLAQWISGKRLAPRWRCALWLLVVLRLCLPFSFSSRESIFNLFPQWNVTATSVSTAVQTLPTPQNIESDPIPQITSIEPQNQEWQPIKPVQPVISETPSAAKPISVQNIPQSEPNKPAVQFSWLSVAFWIWLAGATTLLCHILISSIRLSLRFGKLHPLTNSEPLAILDECRQRLSVRRKLQLVESVGISTPALHGIFRPQLLLPKGFTEKFSGDELRFVFLHELAHLKRRDLLMNWAMALLQAAHWFNPLVWFGFARWRADREMACDAMVLETAGAELNKEYGRTILRLLENFTGPLRTPGLVSILENKKQLHHRIGMIANYAPSPRWSLLAMILIGALVLFCMTDARSSAADKPDEPLNSTTSTNEETIRLTVELRDGSRVVGESLQKDLNFHSALFGDLKLALNDIRSIDCTSTNQAKITSVKGDTLMVSFVDTTFKIKTGFGVVAFSANSVRKINTSQVLATSNHPQGLVALWSGDGNETDLIGNYNADLHDISYSDGQNGRAFLFNGISSFFEISNSLSERISQADGVSISTTIKPTDILGIHPIVQWLKVGDTPYGLNLRISERPDDFGVIYADFVDEQHNLHQLKSSQGVLINNTFQHVVLTYDKSSGRAFLYLNGKVVAQNQWNITVPFDSNMAGIWVGRVYGDLPGEWSYNRHFVGEMKDLAIYDHALTSSQVLDEFEKNNR